MVPIFFKTKDEIMWFAISMFEEKYLAFPKYYFDNGKKIKGSSYSQWYTNTPKQFEKYYTYVEGIGEKAFLVDPKEIIEFYNPIARAQSINDGSAEQNEHIKTVQRLLINMQKFLKIPIDDIGIDGSSLLGDYKDTSDIDILVYGKENGDRLKESFRNFDKVDGIRLFYKNDLQNNEDVPKTVYTTGFGQDKEQAFEQFLRRYYGYIGKKRFSIVCVPKENELGYININRKLKRTGDFEGQVLIVDDTYSGIVPTIYKVADSKGKIYTLEIFNHYGINQAREGERFLLSGQLYDNRKNNDQSIIISFWTDREQLFSLAHRERKQEILDRLRTLLLQEKNEKNSSVLLSMINEISARYTKADKEETINQAEKYYKDGKNAKPIGSIAFLQNPLEILDTILRDRNKLEKLKQTKCGLNFYCIRAPKCGKRIDGGKEKDLDYATIVTLGENNELVSFLPTEKLELLEREQSVDEDIEK